VVHFNVTENPCSQWTAQQIPSESLLTLKAPLPGKATAPAPNRFHSIGPVHSQPPRFAPARCSPPATFTVVDATPNASAFP